MALEKFYQHLSASRSRKFLSNLAVNCFLCALVHTPSLCRNWFEGLGRKQRENVDLFTSKFLSPVVIRRAYESLNSDKDANQDEKLAIKIFQGQNIIQAQYSIEDFAVDVKLSFAKNYPLGRINIEEVKKKKIG